jgi:hypothetical protein
MTETTRRQPGAQDADDLRRETERPADSGEVSPHFGGRAQPGDILGIETGGEVTELGDTSEDENERRRKAEEEDAKIKKG